MILTAEGSSSGVGRMCVSKFGCAKFARVCVRLRVCGCLVCVCAGVLSSPNDFDRGSFSRVRLRCVCGRARVFEFIRVDAYASVCLCACIGPICTR
jgi:hypothetical protein